MQKRRRNTKKSKFNWIMVMLLLMLCVVLKPVTYATAADSGSTQSLSVYYDYLNRMEAVETVEDIAKCGFSVIEDQIFPVQLETFGEMELTFVPAIEQQLGRLVLFLTDEGGQVLYRTGQLATNQRIRGSVSQPTRGIAAVSFQDVNQDNRKDIVLITTCVNETGEYAGQPYKVGDVLFQGEHHFLCAGRQVCGISLYIIHAG